MQTIEKRIAYEKNRIYQLSDESANRFNMIFLTVLLFFCILSELFNEFGVFDIPKTTMRISISIVCLVFLVPIGIYIVWDLCLKRTPSVFSKDWFLAIILVSVFIGVAEICVVYTVHAVVLLAVPPLVVAQYRKHTKLFWWGVAGTLLLVPISVYGGFFFGNPDRNLLRIAPEAEAEFAHLANRLALATPKRMLDLLFHYTVPRWFCVSVVMVLATGITRRNERMVARQEELTSEVQSSMERRTAMQAHVIESLATLIETRDEGTGEHVLRTKKYVSLIANAMKDDPVFHDRMTPEEIDRIENAAPLHDIGKIAISDTILLKPGKLTAEEFDKMKTHTVKGERMISTLLAQMDDPLFLKTAEDIVIAHHEKWDGTGYPYGKKGEEIPLSARIMAVADVFDALVSYRVYKPSISPEKALETVYSESGTHFDPEIIRVVKSIGAELIAAANAPAEPAK